MFGPYIKLPAGSYTVKWFGRPLPSSGEVIFMVAADGGKEELLRRTLLVRDVPSDGVLTELQITMPRARAAVEFTVYSRGAGRFALDKLVVERK